MGPGRRGHRRLGRGHGPVRCGRRLGPPGGDHHRRRDPRHDAQVGGLYHPVRLLHRGGQRGPCGRLRQRRAHGLRPAAAAGQDPAQEPGRHGGHRGRRRGAGRGPALPVPAGALNRRRDVRRHGPQEPIRLRGHHLPPPGAGPHRRGPGADEQRGDQQEKITKETVEALCQRMADEIQRCRKEQSVRSDPAGQESVTMCKWILQAADSGE